jgi:hypothetical protein
MVSHGAPAGAGAPDFFSAPDARPVVGNMAQAGEARAQRGIRGDHLGILEDLGSKGFQHGSKRSEAVVYVV